MASKIKVSKITEDGLIECSIDDIKPGDRFMYRETECMRVADWTWPPYLAGVPLYVNMDTFELKFVAPEEGITV